MFFSSLVGSQQESAEVFAIQCGSSTVLGEAERAKLAWLLQAEYVPEASIAGSFVGPRKEVVSPWSTNATEIAENVGILGIVRMERFSRLDDGTTPVFDRMVEAFYEGLDQSTLVVDRQPEPVVHVQDIAQFNQAGGLALSDEEVQYLEEVSETLGRKLTDAEVYGFSQINSEHCRHKIFNGEFVIDGSLMPSSLFSHIKQTSKHAPDYIVSAYSDNVAFMKGPELLQFKPQAANTASYFTTEKIPSVLSLKAETHNFPTAVEPFYGASTGGGGEIRDRMAGGIGSIPLAGTAVYMTSYPRLRGSRAGAWEKETKERDWKYQTPAQILVKASNGASDFGNKFGQPLISGSILTFEGRLGAKLTGFDRCIMLAGGVGFANAAHALKGKAATGDKIVLLGGDNYRIGMAGGSVSSVDTGEYGEELELSAVQRANPEMQKRVYNTIRALCEQVRNPIKIIHDHGAGGHVNCFSEILEEGGGIISIAELPIGDPTLSAKEILCNESQERMGLLLAADDVALLQEIASRERAPCYVIGEVTGDGSIVFEDRNGERPMDLPLEVLFGSSPTTRLEDSVRPVDTSSLEYTINDAADLQEAVKNVLSLESVACKDWLTNKVDRCVTGLVAQQQCVGPLHLPLSNVGVMALDYTGQVGTATAIGHAPVVGLLDERAGSVLSVAEALTNLVWAPLPGGLPSVSLSANWMWPAKQPGEDARLYSAVEALSAFSIELGVPVPTGKDSLSMTMKYPDGESVSAPGTVVVSSMAEVSDVSKCVTPDLKPVQGSALLYVDFSGMKSFPLGGSSFAQSIGQLGNAVPTVANVDSFKAGFALVQELVHDGSLLAGHDISSGGLISALCEMAFAGDVGIDITLSGSGSDLIEQLFCEKPAVLLQVETDALEAIQKKCEAAGLVHKRIAEVRGTQIRLHAADFGFSTSVADLRRVWFKPSFLLDSKQTKPELAKERYERFDAHPLSYTFPANFTGKMADLGIDLERTASSGVRAAVIRDKGTNGDREMALSLFAAGFDVKDITTTDLMSGAVTLEDVQFVVFPGGFSNSDVLGAARGWAGVFKYNENAGNALRAFYQRDDTLSLGVCNGCQLVVGLDLIYPEHDKKIAMGFNESGKFESSFVNLRIQETNSVMFKPLIGSQLGIWNAHGEGRFILPEAESAYDIPAKYVSVDYPANPNGSDANAAAICSADGRHLAIMPHLERSMFSWNWAYRGGDDIPDFEISPWILAFQAARTWIEK